MADALLPASSDRAYCGTVKKSFAVLLAFFFFAAMAQAPKPPAQRLSPEEAISVARHNPKTEKLGGTFRILMEMPSNADTRRVGDQALAQAQARKVDLYENGLLANVLRSGGFLLLQILPPTNNANSVNSVPFVSIFHLVTLGRDSRPEDVFVGPGLNLADTQELMKSTIELVERLYSTPSTEESSLESRFYGGSFLESDQFQGSLFAVPPSLRKLGADPNELREAVALYGGYVFWVPRYAFSMPLFAANPVKALIAAADKEEALTAQFLRSNHIDPNLHLDLDNIRSEKQLQERVQLLARLDKFLEGVLKNESDPSVVAANLSIATMPLGVGTTSGLGQGIYISGTPSMFEFFWQRLPTGGFVVKWISEADVE